MKILRVTQNWQNHDGKRQGTLVWLEHNDGSQFGVVVTADQIDRTWLPRPDILTAAELETIRQAASKPFQV